MKKKNTVFDSPQNMTDLSEKMGLSRSTLSYILNDRWRPRGISEATANKVLSYVRSIGFQPNLLGRALSGKTIKDVAIIIPPVPYDHHKEAYFRLLESLDACGLGYLVLPGNEERLPETARFLKMYRVKQVVVFAAKIREVDLPAWRQFFGNVSEARTILFDFPFERIEPKAFADFPDQKMIGIDRRKARRMLMESMTRAGYRKLILPGSWKEILAEVTPENLPLEVAIYDAPAADTNAALFESASLVADQIKKMIKNGPPAVAFIPDDKWAWSIIHALKGKGVLVPKDVAICSWDGLTESRFFSPSLTTLAIPHEAMLAEVVRWLNGGEMKRSLLHEAELREGESMPKRPV